MTSEVVPAEAIKAVETARAIEALQVNALNGMTIAQNAARLEGSTPAFTRTYAEAALRSLDNYGRALKPPTIRHALRCILEQTDITMKEINGFKETVLWTGLPDKASTVTTSKRAYEALRFMPQPEDIK